MNTCKLASVRWKQENLKSFQGFGNVRVVESTCCSFRGSRLGSYSCRRLPETHKVCVGLCNETLLQTARDSLPTPKSVSFHVKNMETEAETTSNMFTFQSGIKSHTSSTIRIKL